MGFLNRFFGKKEAPIQTYADFWHWFAEHEKSFMGSIKAQKNIEKVFFDPMSERLDQLKPKCFYFLVGMLDDHTVDMIFSAEGAVSNFAFIEALVNAAPTLPGWKFTPLKPAATIKDNFSLRMGGNEFAEDNIFFYENESEAYPDEIDITFVYAAMNQDNKDAITNGVYVFLDNYLGELEFAQAIDQIRVIPQSEAQKPLRSMKYLKDYLNIRQKQFVEKYEGKRAKTNDDEYALMEAKLSNGLPLLATVNTRILTWDAKASHPWIAMLKLYYDGSTNQGMPSKPENQLMYDIEDHVLQQLVDDDGYLNIGRETADGLRELYFACKDFRQPALVFYSIMKQYDGKLHIEYDIYKDKYWKTFERYQG